MRGPGRVAQGLRKPSAQGPGKNGILPATTCVNFKAGDPSVEPSDETLALKLTASYGDA